jgi:hypothetical protein
MTARRYRTQEVAGMSSARAVYSAARANEPQRPLRGTRRRIPLHRGAGAQLKQSATSASPSSSLHETSVSSTFTMTSTTRLPFAFAKATLR